MSLADALTVLDAAERRKSGISGTGVESGASSTAPAPVATLRDKVAFSARQDPDRFARALTIADRRQIPISSVERNLDRFEALEKGAELDRAAVETRPLTAKWLSESETNRRVGHDDLETLSGIEWAWKAGGAAYSSGYDQLRLSELSERTLTGGRLTPEEALEEYELERRVSDSYGGEGWFEHGLVGVTRMLPLLMESAESSAQYAAAGAATGATAGLVGGVTAAPFAVGGATLGVAYGAYREMSRLERNLAFREYRGIVDAQGNTIDPAIARTAAEFVGFTNGLAELGATSVLLGVTGVPAAWRAITGKQMTSIGLRRGVAHLLQTSPTFGARVARAAAGLAGAGAAEIGEEAVQAAFTELGQQAAAELSDVDVGGVSPGRVGARAFAEAAAAAPAALMLAGAGVGVGATASMAAHGARAATAQLSGQKLDRAVAASSESKLRERSRESFESFVQQLQGGERADLEISPDVLVAYFQSRGETVEDALADVPNVLVQIAPALEVGGDVVIPLETYLSTLAQDHHEGLRADLRVAGGMSLRESETWSASADAFVASAEEVEAEAASEADSSQRVYDDVFRGLVQEAGYDETAAGSVAALWKARYVERARRQGADPFDLYSRENVTIAGPFAEPPRVRQPKPALEELLGRIERAPEPERPAVSAEVVAEIDRILGDIRERREPEVAGLGRFPVLSVLKRRGGIDPTSSLASELRHLGVTNKTLPGIFRKGGLAAVDDLDLALEPVIAGNIRASDEASARIDPNDLLAAIQAEMQGQPLRTAVEQESIASERGKREEFVRALEELGLDVATTTAEQFLQRHAQEQVGGLEFEQRAGVARPNALHPEREKQANRALNLLKKPAMARYGFAYTGWLRGGAVGVEPERGKGVTLAEAQRVRDLIATFRLWELEQQERGSITFDEKLNRVAIKLTEAQNLSTFLHESGHLFFEQLRQDGLAQRSDEDVRDWTVVAEHLGLAPDAVLSRDHHEQLARTFEAYLMEGKAPSEELRGVFSRFRAWLVLVYETLGQLRIRLTPEIREVMDRMVASDDAIALAREIDGRAPLFTDAASSGQTEAEFELYKRTAAKARREQQEELDRRFLKELAARRSEAGKSERARVRTEVETEINATPMYLARHWLQTGKWLDGRESTLEHQKLSKRALTEIYGEELLKLLPSGPSGVWQHQGGYAPDEIAESFGFRTGDELVRALQASENRRSVIEAETDARMRAREGWLDVASEAVEQALESLPSESAAHVLSIEERVLARRAGMEPTPRQVAHASARRIVEHRRLRDLRPDRARQAQRKASREAVDALAAGDFAAAADAKRRELVQHFVEIESRKALEEQDSAIAGIRKLETKRARERIGKAGADYLEQIDKLLERFSFRPISLRRAERLRGLAEWITEQEEAGEEVIISPELRDEAFRVHYRSLTVGQLRALSDAVQHIAHLARKKNEFASKRERIELDALAEDLATQADENIRRKPTRTNRPIPRGTDKLFNLGLRFEASMEKMERVADALAGAGAGQQADASSAWHRAVMQPLFDGQARYNALTEEYTRKVDELVLRLRQKSDRGMLTEKVYPELRTAEGPLVAKRWDLIAIALNLGNRSNREKLLGGYAWEFERVMGVLNRELTAADWEFVQGVWDTVNSLWPEIEAMEKRVSGVAPPKIEAMPLETAAHGTLKGGYYPVVYDPRRSRVGEANLAKTVFGRQPDGYTRATTGHGHTEARTKFKGPILLSLEVLSDHLDQVILDLSFRESLMEVDKVLRHPKVNAALSRNLGHEFSHRQYWLPALQAIAGDTRSPKLVSFWHRGLRHLRKSVTAFKLGFRETTLLVQISGHSNAVNELKRAGLPLKYWRDGLFAAFGGLDPERMRETFREVQELSPFMLHRVGQINRDFRDVIRESTIPGTTARHVERVKAFALELISRVQMITVDYPVWLAAHQGALEQLGLEGDAAVHFADRMVRLSQGGGTMIEQAGVERGGAQGDETLKALNLFYSYFNTVYNQLRAAGRGARVKDVPAFLATYLLTVSLPGLYAYAIYAATHGSWPDDDEKAQAKLLRDLIRATALEGASTIPLVRELMPLVVGESKRSAAATEVLGREIQDLRNYTDATDLMFDVLRTGSLFVGLPVDRIARATEKAIRPDEEETE